MWLTPTPGTGARICYRDNDPSKYSTHLAFTCWRSATSPQWSPLDNPQALESMLQWLYAAPRPPPIDAKMQEQMDKASAAQRRQAERQAREAAIQRRLEAQQQNQVFLDAIRERGALRAMEMEKQERRFIRTEPDEPVLVERSMQIPVVTDWYAARPKIVKPWTPSSVLLREGLVSSVRKPRSKDPAEFRRMPLPGKRRHTAKEIAG